MNLSGNLIPGILLKQKYNFTSAQLQVQICKPSRSYLTIGIILYTGFCTHAFTD